MGNGQFYLFASVPRYKTGVLFLGCCVSSIFFFSLFAPIGGVFSFVTESRGPDRRYPLSHAFFPSGGGVFGYDFNVSLNNARKTACVCVCVWYVLDDDIRK